MGGIRTSVVALAVALAGPAGAFTLEAPVHLANPPQSPRDTSSAIAAAGDTVTFAWGRETFRSNDVVALTSTDRGATFGPVEVVHRVPTTAGPHRELSPFPKAAPALSADATLRVVLGGVDLVDTRLPPLQPSPYGDTPVEFTGLFTWDSALGGRWDPAAYVDAMTDRCDAGGHRCLHLSDVAFALADDGASGWAAYSVDVDYLGANQRHDVIVTPVTPGAPSAPIHLSAAFPSWTGGWGAQVDVDAAGGTVLVTWGPYVHLARSVDGGATWSDLYLPYENAADVAVARDTGLTVLATGAWDPLVPGQRWIQVRTSADGGATFGPPVVVDTGSGIDAVRVATSRDGATLAVAYATVSAPGDVLLSVSEDAGLTWSRVGTVGRWTFLPDFDLAMAPDGDDVYVTIATPDDGTTFYRAVR